MMGWTFLIGILYLNVFLLKQGTLQQEFCMSSFRENNVKPERNQPVPRLQTIELVSFCLKICRSLRLQDLFIFQKLYTTRARVL